MARAIPTWTGGPDCFFCTSLRALFILYIMCVFLNDKTRMRDSRYVCISNQSDYNSLSWTDASRVLRNQKRRSRLSETVFLRLQYKVGKQRVLYGITPYRIVSIWTIYQRNFLFVFYFLIVSDFEGCYSRPTCMSLFPVDQLAYAGIKQFKTTGRPCGPYFPRVSSIQVVP